NLAQVNVARSQSRPLAFVGVSNEDRARGRATDGLGDGTQKRRRYRTPTRTHHDQINAALRRHFDDRFAGIAFDDDPLKIGGRAMADARPLPDAALHALSEFPARGLINRRWRVRAVTDGQLRLVLRSKAGWSLP